jgi:hypothetical protein
VVTVAGVFGMPLHDGISIGLLLNTKRIIELVILNMGKNKKIISDQCRVHGASVHVGADHGAGYATAGIMVKPARRLSCSTSDGPSRGRSPTPNSTCWPALGPVTGGGAGAAPD